MTLEEAINLLIAEYNKQYKQKEIINQVQNDPKETHVRLSPALAEEFLTTLEMKEHKEKEPK